MYSIPAGQHIKLRDADFFLIELSVAVDLREEIDAVGETRREYSGGGVGGR